MYALVIETRKWIRTDTMPIFEKNGRRVAFIHIPKAAGSSVEKMFKADGRSMSLFKQTYDGYTVSDQHKTYSSLKEDLHDLDELDSFTITREPFSRLVSEWGYQTDRIQSSALDFHDFVRHVECSLKVNKEYWDNHFRPQTDFLDDRMNAVIKMERMQEELPSFLQERGILSGAVIPHANKVNDGNTRRQISLDAETRERIMRVYERDYLELGYEPAFPTAD